MPTAWRRAQGFSLSVGAALGLAWVTLCPPAAPAAMPQNSAPTAASVAATPPSGASPPPSGAALYPSAASGSALPPASVSPEQWLLSQVRLGEATQQDLLVRQSLERLALIAPDDPQVLAAQIRADLREGNSEQAGKRLEKLRQLAPDSVEFRQSRLSLALARPETQQRLQQARLMATAGRLDEARALYDALFNGPPPPDLALEYWQLVARLPGRKEEAVRQLTLLDRLYPGNAALQLQLARDAFAAGQEEQAIGWLEQAADTSLGRDDAAQLWLSWITAQPVSPQSLAALKRYLIVFNDGAAAVSGQKALQQQQALLADPRYQARLDGLAKIERGAGANAIKPLSEALAAAPNDAQVLGALGLAYARAGDRQRALGYFEQAQRAEPNGFNSGKWQSLIATNRYWWALQQGDGALNAGRIAEAEKFYRQASEADPQNAWAWVGLGDAARARRDDPAAEQAYRHALRLARNNASAERGLIDIYQRQSPERALNYIQQLPAAEGQKWRDKQISLETTLLTDQAERDANAGRWPQAALGYRQALALSPQDSWTTYHYAQALRQLGQPAQGDALMAELAARYPADAGQVYAYGLYLAAGNQDDAALAHLHTLPEKQWSEGMSELARRIKQSKRRERINQRLDAIDRALAAGDTKTAHKALFDGDISGQDLSLDQRRRVAMAWLAVGDTARAATLAALKPQAQTLPPGQDKALFYRDAARIEWQQGHFSDARADYRQAMLAAGMTGVLPANNDDDTRLTRQNTGDDWLRSGIRADAAQFYRGQDVNVTLDNDFWRNSGTPGKSDLRANTTMMQAELPWLQGRAFGRADVVHMDAGTLNKKYGGAFGTCADLPCRGDRSQTATGVSLGAGWENDRFKGDIGTTPLGFPVAGWVGGAAVSGDWRALGWNAGLSRRPLSSSLLSFAGVRDPGTGMTWGGVRATGGNVALNYDRGGANGLWSDISAHRLIGKNVADNSRERLMGGYYYKLINQDDRRATVGLNSMLWHYRRDLSGYTLGQGGYYSPQRYVSLSVPVNYRAREENVAWQLGASLAWSHAATGNQQRYPLAGVDDADNHSSPGGGGSGFGYTVQALVERRLTSHWTLGAGVDIQQARDYTPSHILAYLRYSLAGRQGDMNLPPQPLIPYADFK